MRIKSLPKLFLSLFITLFAGFLVSLLTTPSISTWYNSLIKPPFNPPNWVFGPVWTFLFILIGISLYFILLEPKRKNKSAVTFFGIQLALNVLWSLLFFYIQKPAYALVEIVILWFAILLTIIKFYKISKIAAYLLIPYIIWVSFAFVLNLSIVLLNA